MSLWLSAGYPGGGRFRAGWSRARSSDLAVSNVAASPDPRRSGGVRIYCPSSTVSLPRSRSTAPSARRANSTTSRSCGSRQLGAVGGPAARRDCEPAGSSGFASGCVPWGWLWIAANRERGAGRRTALPCRLLRVVRLTTLRPIAVSSENPGSQPRRRPRALPRRSSAATRSARPATGSRCPSSSSRCSCRAPARRAASRGASRPPSSTCSSPCRR